MMPYPTEKPRVQYSDAATIEVGKRAYVHVINHPIVGSGWALTGAVLGVMKSEVNGPVFETRRTIYFPAETDESMPKASARNIPIAWSSP